MRLGLRACRGVGGTFGERHKAGAKLRSVLLSRVAGGDLPNIDLFPPGVSAKGAHSGVLMEGGTAPRRYVGRLI